MKYMVGYDGGPASKKALELACTHAKASDALVYLITSTEGGATETPEQIKEVEDRLQQAKDILLKEQVQCETIQLARGLSPGEDMVQFARDNSIDVIFMGIEKKSRTRKILLGSTAQYVILKGPCPVTTTK